MSFHIPGPDAAAAERMYSNYSMRGLGDPTPPVAEVEMASVCGMRYGTVHLSKAASELYGLMPLQDYVEELRQPDLDAEDDIPNVSIYLLTPEEYNAKVELGLNALFHPRGNEIADQMAGRGAFFTEDGQGIGFCAAMTYPREAYRSVLIDDYSRQTNVPFQQLSKHFNDIKQQPYVMAEEDIDLQITRAMVAQLADYVAGSLKEPATELLRIQEGQDLLASIARSAAVVVGASVVFKGAETVIGKSHEEKSKFALGKVAMAAVVGQAAAKLKSYVTLSNHRERRMLEKTDLLTQAIADDIVKIFSPQTTTAEVLNTLKSVDFNSSK